MTTPMSLQELRGRRRLCELFIQELEAIDDPRRDGAIAEYRQQQAELDARIAELVPPAADGAQPAAPEDPDPAGKPPAVVVGLKPAVLFAKDGKE